MAVRGRYCFECSEEVKSRLFVLMLETDGYAANRLLWQGVRIMTVSWLQSVHVEKDERIFGMIAENMRQTDPLICTCGGLGFHHNLRARKRIGYFENLFIHLSVQPPAHLPICPSAHLPICPSGDSGPSFGF